MGTSKRRKELKKIKKDLAEGQKEMAEAYDELSIAMDMLRDLNALNPEDKKKVTRQQIRKDFENRKKNA